MSYEDHDRMTSAELQREIAADRRRIDTKLAELQARLQPGRIAENVFNSRMAAEAMTIATRGGADFAGRFGRSVAANPLPAALLGVSLAWLMAGPRPFGDSSQKSYEAESPSYRTIEGEGLRRVSHSRDESGDWYSEFADNSGATYRAKSNESGHRIGDFFDSAGDVVGGFVDKSGRAVTRFTDEAGALLDEATGWARSAAGAVAGAVSGLTHKAGRAGNSLAHGAGRVGGGLADSANHFGDTVRHGASRATREATRMIEEQPLVVAAIAFAAGAAIAAALPRTSQEDELIGDLSDEARAEAARLAGSLYEQGKEAVSEVYEDVSREAGDMYEEARGRIAGKASDDGQTGVRH